MKTMTHSTRAYFGSGIKVHVMCGDHALCGVGRPTYAHNVPNPRPHHTQDPLSCQRCLHILDVTIEPSAEPADLRVSTFKPFLNPTELAARRQQGLPIPDLGIHNGNAPAPQVQPRIEPTVPALPDWAKLIDLPTRMVQGCDLQPGDSVFFKALGGGRRLIAKGETGRNKWGEFVKWSCKVEGNNYGYAYSIKSDCEIQPARWYVTYRKVASHGK